MRENFQIIIDWILELPPRYIQVLCGIGFIIIIYIVWPRGDQAPAALTLGVSNDALSFETHAEERPALPDFYEEMVSAAKPETRVRIEANRNLRQLEAAVSRQILEGSLSPPVWVSENFSGTGIDRGSFKSRFTSDTIEVQRWQRGDKVPTFNRDSHGDVALEKFIWSCFEPWKNSRDFRISIKPYKTDVDGPRITVGLVVECFGELSEINGRQATAIWSSVWIDNSSTLLLQSLNAVAQEEVSTVVPGGQLFRDCTAALLRRTECLESQLVYGLDQWARRIPGIDIVGEQGVAVSDINGDGLDDIYLCQPHGLPNLLLIQNPDGTLEDVGHQAGVDFLDESHGALILDLDNDRDQDLVVTCDEGLLLVSNQGGMKFQLEHVLPIGRNALSISAADFDQDGDLDLFLCKSLDVDRHRDLLNFPQDFRQIRGGRNVLLRNDEGWDFVDVTEQVGFTTNNHDFSRCALWVDLDRDGDQDLYVTNEFSTDRVFRNDKGWFSEITNQLGIETSARHRSASTGEFNADGLADFFVGTDMPLLAKSAFAGPAAAPDSLPELIQKIFTGEDQVWFSDRQSESKRAFYLRAPLFASETSFGSVATDVDNDGRDDVVVANGLLSRFSTDDVIEPFYDLAFEFSEREDPGTVESRISKSIGQVSDVCRSGYSISGNQRNRCYLSLGDLGFANISAASGLDLTDDARSVAASDWDNDGDMDVVMTSRTGPRLRIFCNQLSKRNRFVSFQLVGVASNLDAIGATLELYVEGAEFPLTKTLQAGSGFLAQSSKRILFGLGQREKIEKLVVTWPSGKQQEFDSIFTNTHYQALEGKSELAEQNSQRFGFENRRTSLQGIESMPKVGRTILYPRSCLPNLTFQGAAEKFYPLKTIKEKPLLAVFCTHNADSIELLRKFRVSAALFAEAGLDCLALYCDETSRDPARNWKNAEDTVSQSRYPFRWGALTPGSTDKLKLVFGEWFAYQHLPQMPFALLLAPGGDVVGYYSMENIDFSQVARDLELIDATQQDYRIAASPFPGQWATRYRFRDDDRLINRLQQLGFGEDCGELIAKSQPYAAYQMVHQAIELVAQNELAEARNLLNEATQLDPANVMACVQSGELMRKMASQAKLENPETSFENLRLAAVDFDRALKLDPLNSEAIIGRANVAIDQGQLEDAIAKLIEYLQLDPERYEVHAILGRLLFYQDKHREALGHLITAFENRPSLPYVSGDLGFLYLVSGEFKQARKFLQLANRQQPSDKNILRLLAEAECAFEQHEQAIELFERVVVNDPTLRRPKTILAWLLATCPYESRRDGKRSLEIMQPIFELAGDNSPSILEIYAAGFAEIGDFDKALEMQDRAVELVKQGRGDETYTSSQTEGLIARQELYRRKKPYRTADIEKNPIRPPGRD